MSSRILIQMTPVSVPGHATVVLAGWCAVILTGASVVAKQERDYNFVTDRVDFDII